MDTASLARIAVALVCVAGFVALILILNGDEDDAGRAFYVALSFAFFSLTGAAGMKLARRGSEVVTYLFGYLTVAASVVAFGEVLSMLWEEEWLGNNWKSAAQLTLATFAAANVSLLFASEQPEDGREVHAARIGAVLALVALSILLLVEISSSGPDVSPKLLGTLALFYVLGAVLIPLLRRAELSRG
jgi:hypothetical protein